MKIRKLMCILLATLLFTGCSVNKKAKMSSKEYAELLWQIKINPTAENLKELDISKKDSEEIINQTRESECEDLKIMMSNLNIELSDEQIESIYDSYVGALLKNTATFEEVEQTETTSKIRISSTTINLTDIIIESEYESYDKVKELKLSDEDEIQKRYSELFCETIINKLNNAVMSEKIAQNEFNFIKNNKNEWVPEDSSEFMQSIGKMNVN